MLKTKQLPRPRGAPPPNHLLLPHTPPSQHFPSPPPPPPPPLPPPHSVHHILSLLRQCNFINSIKQVHSHMLTSFIQKDNHLLFRLIELRDLPYAALLFHRIPRPDDFAYNVMIRGLATTWDDYPLAIEFYLRMVRSGERPNNFTYPFVLIALANLRCLHYGRTTHSSVFKSGLHSDSHTQHSLITMYARCGQLGEAKRVFDEISERDLVSWNSMISGYSKMGFAGEAVALFRGMRMAGFEPNEMTLVSVMTACGDLGDLSLGMWLEELAVGRGMDFSSFVGCALIAMYGKCGNLDSARRVFDGLPKKDLVAWNAMITGYAQNGLSDEAITLFQAMREARVEPSKITMVGVLSACAAVGALDLGTWVDAYASQKGLLHDVYVGTALIDMYAKCGNLDRAIQIFQGMPWKNVVSWNAMISAFAFHGRGQEALSLFTHMRDEEETVHPNDITLVGVLSACVHAGWVDEGRKWFNSMQPMFGIVPQIEHYSCMVDLLARAGRLEEAWDFIETMPKKPDAVVLGALLGACRTCKNVEVGERVIHRLLELEPSNSGNYVISSRIYAGSKRWDDSARMRGLMRERGVSKTPGCSWIEVWNQVHEFRSGDGLHLRSIEIHQMIDILKDDMKIEGYSPNIDLV